MGRSDTCPHDGVIRLRESSHVISSRQLGTEPCFHQGQDFNAKLQASTGQQINITLIDFQNGATVTSRACTEYGHVTDVQTKQGVPLCGFGERERTLFLSNSNSVDLTIKAATTLPNFALKLEGKKLLKVL
jgi:hypothetical protein